MTKVQEETLIFYKELAEIFQNNNIQFAGVCGTAIGALREKGFIPWDDDIDLGIKEEDYEKVKKLIRNSGFKFHTKYDGQDHQFLKVYKPTVLTKNKGEVHFLSIDIFIFYKKRKGIEKAIIKNNKLADFYLMRSWSFETWSKSDGKFTAFWIKLFSRILIFPKFISDVTHKRIKRLEVADDGKYYLYSDTIRMSHYQACDFQNLSKLKFEDCEISVSKSFASDNVGVFGDVFVVPPVEKRTHHNIEIIEVKND